MRVFSIIATSLGVALGSFAAEPMKVSVYPVGMNPKDSTTTTVADAPATTTATTTTTAPNVFDGTLVPNQTRMVGGTVTCDTPSAAMRDRILPLAPTVCIPISKDTSDCGKCSTSTVVPCGPRLTIDCGPSFCESPGRPGVFAGFFTRTTCNTCSTTQTKSCDTAECAPTSHIGSGSCFNGTILMRIKNWLFFRPCDGPRIGLFRPNPYVPRSISAFPMNCGHVQSMCGTCQAGACSGSGLMGRFVRGNESAGCDSGTCATGKCGDGLGLGAGIGSGSCSTGTCGQGLGLGLGGRLLGGRTGTKDCNNAEPKLGGTSFGNGYHFATVTPKVYGSEAIQIDPITGLVKMPKEKVEKKEAVTNESTKIEQASATVPVSPSSRMNTVKPAVNTVNSTVKKDSKSNPNPIATPFSNP